MGEGRTFTVIDTGGYATGTEDAFEGVIRKQVELSIEESGLILFLVDAQTGITDLDSDIAHMVRRSGKTCDVDREQGGYRSIGIHDCGILWHGHG